MIPPRQDFFILPRQEIRLVFIWTKYIAEFFIPARWDEVCLYGNFSSRLGGILASVADILSRWDKWQDHINTL
jgi:hypothetical protein